MTKNPILLNKMMEDLVQAVSPEKMQAIHDKLDRIITLLTAAPAEPPPAAAPEPPKAAAKKA